MREIVAKSGLEAQDQLAETVASAKKVDPFKHITLIVESNHQALQFRRQLLRSLARIKASTSLVSFSAHTKVDLLSKIAELAELDWTYDAYDQARQNTLREVLLSRNETFAKLADHAESFETINFYTKQFDWQILNSKCVGSIKGLAQQSTTKVSLDLLEIALTTQEQVKSLGQRSPAEVAQLIEDNATDDQRQRINQSLGLVISLVSDYPVSLANLLENLVGADNHQRLSLQVGGQRESAAQVVSYPDPETEAKGVVREVAKRISEGHDISQFAVLYSDANQYSELLEHEFEQAQITWNGIATDSPAITRAALAAKGFFAVANSVLGTGTFTRADLLLLLRVSSLTLNGKEVRASLIERYVSKNSLFNEVKNWVPVLQAAFNRLPELNKELSSVLAGITEQQEIDEIQYEIRQAETAGTVVELIDALTTSIEKLASVSSHRELADQMWIEINSFFPQISEAKVPIERLTYEKLADLFGSAHGSAISDKGSVRKLLNALGQSIFLKLRQLKLQHGELARGIYVGPVSQNGALYFENLWVLGAGDGMLPQAISEDPIFPDSLKALVASETSTNFKSVSDRVFEIEANFAAVTTGAGHLMFSYPRGATLVKGEGKPSAWLDKVKKNTTIEVQAANEFRLEKSGAISTSDLHSKQSAAGIGSQTTKSKQLEAALWFLRPEATDFVGNLAQHDAEPVFDFAEKSLSASSVEKFLKCEHNFFTTKVLGISDMEDADSIDEVRALDFGKAVHKSFERLLKEFPQLNPDFGKPYSDEAKSQFVLLFNEECDLMVARGQAGWAPLFESRKRSFLEMLAEYFKFEAAARQKVASPEDGEDDWDSLHQMRDSDLLQPKLAEFAFHKTGDGLLQIPVQVQGYPAQTLRFAGSIDRVDASANGEHVGVLDFKTGSKSSFDGTTAIQDLLYEYAIRNSFQYREAKKVSSRYFFLARKPSEVGLADLRKDRERRVFIPLVDGGLSGSDYSIALAGNIEKSETELRERLERLVSASFTGKFLTHNVGSSSKSFTYCATCRKLGQRQISRLSKVLYPSADSLQIDEKGQI